MKNLVLIAAVLLSASLNAQVFKELESYPLYDEYEDHPYFGEPYRTDDKEGTLFVYSQFIDEQGLGAMNLFNEINRVLSPYSISFDVTPVELTQMVSSDEDGTTYEEFYRMHTNSFILLKVDGQVATFNIGFDHNDK